MAPAAVPLEAQASLHHPFNLDGVWTAAPGVVQFNFVHRFYVTPAPVRKVNNFPTFTLATGLARDVMLGTHYGSNSLVVPGRPNEFELFARWRLVGSDGADGLALSVTPAYNTAARSGDGELAAAYSRGRLTLTGATRYLSKALGGAGSDVALAAGAVLRLNDYVALAGDYARLLDADTTAAWSAGLVFLIPGSPHAFSLHASTAAVNTMQSSSVGFGDVLYGFEFTIPLQLKRFAPWFRGGSRKAAPAAPVANLGAEVEIRSFRFGRDTLYVSTGQAVRWINADPVEHTVTFDTADPGSSRMLSLRDAFVARFERPGTYAYHCTPHPYMRGVVVVTGN